MLIDFTVGNFRSFKEKMTLSMEAAKISGNEDNTFEAHGLSLLKTVGIYGANASGKSNFVIALRFFHFFVKNSNKTNTTSGIENYNPFRLSSQMLSEPSHFEITFIYEGCRYRYGFEIDSKRVVREWFYIKIFDEHKRERKLFERNGDTFEIKPAFRKAKTIVADKLIRDNALLMSIAPERNVAQAIDFRKGLKRIRTLSGLSGREFEGYTSLQLSINSTKRQIINLLNRFNLDIVDIYVEEFPDINRTQHRELQSESLSLKKLLLPDNFEGIKIYRKMNDTTLFGNISARFNLESDESEGTKRMVYFSAPLLDTLEKGHTIVIDEFEASLHPHITHEIVRMFNSPVDNPNNAQSVFVTHDVNLMDNHLQRRDQIWFTEKNKEQATELFSLADFNQIRNESDFRKKYLQGFFGAVPYIPKVCKGLNI